MTSRCIPTMSACFQAKTFNFSLNNSSSSTLNTSRKFIPTLNFLVKSCSATNISTNSSISPAFFFLNLLSLEGSYNHALFGFLSLLYHYDGLIVILVSFPLLFSHTSNFLRYKEFYHEVMHRSNGLQFSKGWPSKHKLKCRGTIDH